MPRQIDSEEGEESDINTIVSISNQIYLIRIIPRKLGELDGGVILMQ